MIQGKVFLVQVQNPKLREPEVDIALWFGDRTVYLFPKEIRGLMKKGMQRASDAVIDKILEGEGIIITPQDDVGLTMPDRGGDAAFTGSPDPGDAAVPSMSPVNVMPTVK